MGGCEGLRRVPRTLGLQGCVAGLREPSVVAGPTGRFMHDLIRFSEVKDSCADSSRVTVNHTWSHDLTPSNPQLSPGHRQPHSLGPVCSATEDASGERRLWRCALLQPRPKGELWVQGCWLMIAVAQAQLRGFTTTLELQKLQLQPS